LFWRYLLQQFWSCFSRSIPLFLAISNQHVVTSQKWYMWPHSGVSLHTQPSEQTRRKHFQIKTIHTLICHRRHCWRRDRSTDNWRLCRMTNEWYTHTHINNKHCINIITLCELWTIALNSQLKNNNVPIYDMIWQAVFMFAQKLAETGLIYCIEQK